MDEMEESRERRRGEEDGMEEIEEEESLAEVTAGEYDAGMGDTCAPLLHDDDATPSSQSDYSSQYVSADEYEEQEFERVDSPAVHETGQKDLTSIAQHASISAADTPPLTLTPSSPTMPTRDIRLLPLTLAELEASLTQQTAPVDMDHTDDHIALCLQKLQQHDEPHQRDNSKKVEGDGQFVMLSFTLPGSR